MKITAPKILIVMTFYASVVSATNSQLLNKFEIVSGLGYSLGILRNTQLPTGEILVESVENDLSEQEFSLGQGYTAMAGLHYKVNNSLDFVIFGQFSTDYLSDASFTYVNISCYSFGFGPQFNSGWSNGFGVWFRSTPSLYFPEMQWVSLFDNYNTCVNFAPAFGLSGSLGIGKKFGIAEISFETIPGIAFSRIREITRTYSNGAKDRLIYSRHDEGKISVETGTALRDRIWYSRRNNYISASCLAFLFTVKLSATKL